MNRAMLALAFFAAALAGSGETRAQTAPPVIGPSVSAAPAAVTQEGGRVIVQLREPTGIARGTSRTARAAYGAAVRTKQESVLAAVFGTDAAGLGRAGRQVKLFHAIPAMALRVTADELARLKASPDVLGVTEDRILRPDLLESLALIRMTGTAGAYSLGATGSGRAVAILDTGVNSAHEFIAGKVVAEACYNTTDIGFGSTSRCPGGEESTATGSAADCPPSEADGCGHGTHVAGIAAGFNTSFLTGEPVNGVAKGASIIAIDVFSKFSATVCGGTACLGAYDSDTLLALQYVDDLKATINVDAANMSLGSGAYLGACDAASPLMKAMIDALADDGVATVIAAGNGSQTKKVSYPGCISSAVTVSASSKKTSLKKERVARYSNMGKVTDLLAPGGDVNYPYGVAVPKNYILSSYDAGYAYLAGTSMAAPHVAGAIAAIRSRPTCQSKTIAQIVNAFHNSGLKITDNRSGPHLVRRRLDVKAAMKYLGCA